MEQILTPGGQVSTNYADTNKKLFDERRKLQQRHTRLVKRREKTKAAKVQSEIDKLTGAIVDFNYGLVRSYVSRFTSHTSAEDSADFESAGLVGLMRAVTTYNPEMGSFAQWAFRPIKREVLSAVRHADHSNMTAGDFERRPHIIRAVAKLSRGGVTPTHAQVADSTGLSVDLVSRVLSAPKLSSLSLVVGDESTDTPMSDLLIDDSPDPLDQVMHNMSVAALESWGLRILDSRELFVIVRRYGLDGEAPQRLSTIGAALGLSRETARQIQSKAIAKLSHPITLRKLVRQPEFSEQR